jgi:DNA-binding MarR family transcriptional regulator
MASAKTPELVNEFLGSMHVLASAVGGVMEDALLQEVAGSQLTVSQLRLLKLVARAEAQTIGDIAASLGVSNAAASKAADRLVRRKLLRRTEGESDRRAILLSLTEAGKRLMRLYEAARDKKLEKVFKQFPLEDLRKTAAMMERLAVSIVSHNANPEEVCLQCKIYFREKCLMREIARHDCFYDRRKSLAHERAARARSRTANGNGLK